MASAERGEGLREGGAPPAEAGAGGERSDGARGGGGGTGVIHVQEHHDVEEVKARLFAAPDLGAVRAEVGSLWSWVSSKGSALASDLAPLGGKLATLGETALSEAERLSKNVIEAAGSLPQLSGAEAGDAGAGEGEGEDGDGNVGGGGSASGGGTGDEAGAAAQAMPPWADPRYALFADAIRTRVLELSADRETFLVAPPPGAAVADAGAVAKRALMSADAQVEEMRLALVPGQVDERAFWRNYLYRVSLVLAAYAPSEAAAQAAAPPAAPADAALEAPGKQASPSWNDDGLDLGEEDHLENFDMLDDDELLASTGLQQGDEDEESAAALEERIKAELSL
jgi:hypothetical protein